MAFRALPELSGCLALVLMTLTGFRAFGRTVAFACALLASLSPTLFRYANEAKPYGVEGLVTTALLFAFFRRGPAFSVHEAIIHGAVKRVRPKMMTVTAAFLGLMPIMWSVGAGADVMKRVAAPMGGGLATSFLMELLVYPKRRSMSLTFASAPHA